MDASPSNTEHPRKGCCETWPKPCSYHEGYEDAYERAYSYKKELRAVQHQANQTRELLNDWRDAFRTYARHSDECVSQYEHPQGIMLPSPDCDCGFQAWLNAAVLPGLHAPGVAS